MKQKSFFAHHLFVEIFFELILKLFCKDILLNKVINGHFLLNFLKFVQYKQLLS